MISGPQGRTSVNNDEATLIPKTYNFVIAKSFNVPVTSFQYQIQNQFYNKIIMEIEVLCKAPNVQQRECGM